MLLLHSIQHAFVVTNDNIAVFLKPDVNINERNYLIYHSRTEPVVRGRDSEVGVYRVLVMEIDNHIYSFHKLIFKERLPI